MYNVDIDVNRYANGFMERSIIMCTTREKIMLCSKTHMTLLDVTKVLGAGYNTLRPEWKKLVAKVEKEGHFVPKYGIRAKTVLEYFQIDVDQLIRLEEYEKKLNA